MTLIAGVEAFRGGRAAILLDGGAFAASVFAASFAQLLGALENAEVVGVDIPVGLSEEGPRPADLAARCFVGPRRNSVFRTPPRPCLLAATYAEARTHLPSLSAQSFTLRNKILEVKRFLEKRIHTRSTPRSRSPPSPNITSGIQSEAGTATPNDCSCSPTQESPYRTNSSLAAQQPTTSSTPQPPPGQPPESRTTALQPCQPTHYDTPAVC
jgi:hypothetical protein